MKYSALIIGLGNIGLQYDKDQFEDLSSVLSHTKALYYSNDFDIIAGIDIDERKRDLFYKLTGSKTFSSLNNIEKEISEVDLVVISSPTETHLKIIKQVITYIKPKIILCEKPLSYNLKDSKKIIEICKKNKVELLINFPRRVEKSIVEIKKIISKNKYFKGTVYYSNGLINNAIHFIDIITFLFGEYKKMELLNINKKYNERDDYDVDFKICFNKGEIYFISWPEKFYSNYKMEIYTDSNRISYDNNGSNSFLNNVVEDPNYSNHNYISKINIDIDNNLNVSILSVYEEVLNLLNGEIGRHELSNTKQMENVHKIIHELKTKINE